MLWALAETGSAANVADHAKHFRGAQLRDSENRKRGVKYVTAGKGELANKGECDIVVKDPHNNTRGSTFQIAEVGLPIFSLSQVTAGNTKLPFGRTTATPCTCPPCRI